MRDNHVHLVTTNFWPEPTGIAVYTTDLVNSLQDFGFEVSVLTSLPHYPWWKIPNEFSHLTEGVTHYGSVEVSRAKHVIPPRMNAIVRIRFECSLWWNLRRISKRLIGKNLHAVIACVPTVAAGMIGKRIAKQLGIPFGLIVQDLSGVGSNFCISQRSINCSGGHDYRSASLEYAHKPVEIKNGSWVCLDAKVLPGVTIGECSVVSAGEIARKSVPNYSMLVGEKIRPIDPPK